MVASEGKLERPAASPYALGQAYWPPPAPAYKS